MDPRERVVHHYELEIRAYVPGATKIKNPSCSNFIDIIDGIDKSKPKGAVLGSRHARSLTVSDWHFDKRKRLCSILLNMNDISKSDVAFRDRNTKSVRMAGKKPTEGIETSSYVCFKLNSDNRTASLVMTMGAGITIDNVSKMLRALINRIRSDSNYSSLFEFNDPSGAMVNGSPKKYSVQYAVEWSLEKSEYLNTVLASGKLDGVELIHSGSHIFDSAGNFVRQRSSVYITPTKSVTLRQLQSAINSYKAKGNPIESARISFRDATGDPKSTSLPINGLTDAFVKRTKIVFQTDVMDQDAQFSNTILIPLQAKL